MTSTKKYTPAPDRKGEINELKTALSDPKLDKDAKLKKEVLQKVIGYMTMGIDTSKLFDKMILVRVFVFIYILDGYYERCHTEKNGVPIFNKSRKHKSRTCYFNH
jgi:hypothetical protein